MAEDADTGSSNPITWVIVSGIATLALVFFPLNELAYLFFGKQATAQVVSVQEYKGRRTRGYDVTFQYTDSSGNSQTGHDSWHISEGAPAKGKVEIEYRSIPYTSSRRGGTVDWVGLILFAIAAGATGFLWFIIVRQLREFRQQEQERAKRRKRKKKVVEEEEDEEDDD